MSVLIENPAACEIRCVIRFLNAKKVKPIEIYRQICEVYGQNSMSDSMVRRWVRQFNEGRSEVHDEERSGHPSLITEELVHAIDEKIKEDRKFTISALAMEFPQISRSLMLEIVTDKLKFHKLCARWVPKILTESHKTKRMGYALEFLTRYHEGGVDFLSQIVTGDETWVSYDTPESKRQSMEWRHTSSLTRDNARPHTANVTKTLLRGFGWDVFDHPPYSPDLAPSNFHLFLHLNSFLAGKHFSNDKELKENVSNWLKTQAATFYEE
ncbi:histone-lysine N-methyltransferase SETMAR [Trichonephila clavipes]|nr:histone-lysine N-methyltransferase SETMAR [Trichonephila clavipes]